MIFNVKNFRVIGFIYPLQLNISLNIYNLGSDEPSIIAKAKRHICLVYVGRYSLLNNGCCQLTSLIYINISLHYILQCTKDYYIRASSYTK